MDAEGHREYKVTYLVEAGLRDGPRTVLDTTGLPQEGDTWSYLDDTDQFAWCLPTRTIKLHEHKEGEPHKIWAVESTFSTKPPDKDKQRCQDHKIEDPLLEPQKVSGNFTIRQEEAVRDRFGRPIVNSAWEQIRGKNVEFDVFDPGVTIEQNVPVLGLELFTPMVQTVNSIPLWGLPPRTVLLANATWERKFYAGCSVYYTRKFEFRIKFDTFDRDILDEATKVLNGHWDTTTGAWVLDNIGGVAPDPNNPTHFIRAKDPKAENIKVILNGAGVPINDKIQGAIIDMTDHSPTEDTVVTSIAHGLTSDDVIVISQLGVIDPTTGLVAGPTDLEGQWAIHVLDPDNFVLLVSRELPPSNVYISGGFWTNVGAAGPGKVHVEKYGESNFLLLGIPTVLQ